MDNLDIAAYLPVSLRVALGALLLFCGVAMNRFSRWLKMPILICFLALGAIGGRHGLNLFVQWDIKTVQQLGEIAICFIIFSGGLETSFRSLKSVFRTGTILATVGVVLTALVTAVCNYFLDRQFPTRFYQLSFPLTLMCSAVFASTDAAAVFAILRGQKAAISPKLQSLLEYESGSNDPAAFLLTVVMIEVACSGSGMSVWGLGWTVSCGIVWGLGMGAAVGLLIGIFGQIFYNWIQKFLEYNGLQFAVAVAIVLLCYGIADGAFRANPLMACYVAGITMGNLRFNFKQTFIKCHNGISWLMQILLFICLGSFFDYRMLFDLRNMLGAVLISLILMFVARPLVVMLCMVRSPFTIKERIFTSWVGIRGSAPIMLAAMVMSSPLAETMPKQVQNFFYVVFTVVLLSILIQGSSLMWVAKCLGLMLPYREVEGPLLEYNERADGRDLAQFTIHPGSVLIGRKMAYFEREYGVILLLVQRGSQLLQPTAELELKLNDRLNFLGERAALLAIQKQFFPGEEYDSPRTFGQLWRDFRRSRRNGLRPSHRHR